MQLQLLCLAANFIGLSSSLVVEKRTSSRAAYVLENNPAGAAIISFSIDEYSGRVSSPVKTLTGGTGGIGLIAAGGGNVAADPLNSQDSVVVSGNYLFTVNAGSSTLSMFTINSFDPTHLTLVGEPADTLGEFPVSVAYSPNLKTACVINTGAVGGVTCFSVDSKKGLKTLDKAPRSLYPALTETATPPITGAASVSDLFFNPSQTALFATVKGNNTAPTTKPATVFAWPVVHGAIATTAVTSQMPDLLFDFGATFAGTDSTLLVSDPTFGAALLTVAPSLHITEKAHISIPPGGAASAICWAIYSPELNMLYVIDAMHTNITSIDPTTGDIKENIQYDTALLGGLDSKPDRSHMYTLTKNGNLVVINLEGTPRTMQAFSLSAFANPPMLQGMAIFPSSLS